MLDFRPILLVNGLLLTTLGVAMLIPALVDLSAGHDDWGVFAASALLTLFMGVSFALTNWGSGDRLSLKEAFMLVVMAWMVLPAFSALPLTFSGLDMSYTDAYFEAMSGLTTTGATVIVGLDDAPPGILLWRSLLQWLGGLGIVFMAIALLPMLQVGGMQLFKVEAFDTAEKVLPSAAQIAGSLSSLYIAFTFFCALFLWSSGMDAFDAVNHAMTSIATGGFSTHDASIGHFDNAAIDIVLIMAMIIGSIPFILYIQAVQGKPLELWKDSQVRVFLGIVVTLIIVLTLYQNSYDINDGMGERVLYASFNVISILTGTGYTNHDYASWGSFVVVVFFVIMFIGGCAGSTSCGIKIFRLQVLIASMHAQIKQIVHPHGVFVPRYNGHPITDGVAASVMGFFFLFFFCFGIIAILLNLSGLDFLTAVSAAGSTISNVGPGLGSIIGPTGTFAPLPDVSKWILAVSMLIGRLEVFTVLVLLSPSFWRN